MQTLIGAQSLNGNTLGYGELSGALVFMDDQLFAARRIDDAFAVVATGVPNVPVTLENRVIGETNSDGDLLITPLNAYQRTASRSIRCACRPDAHIERVDDESFRPIVPACWSTSVSSPCRRLRSCCTTRMAMRFRSAARSSSTTMPAFRRDGRLRRRGLSRRLKPQNALAGARARRRLPRAIRLPLQTGSVPLVGPLVCSKESP